MVGVGTLADKNAGRGPCGVHCSQNCSQIAGVRNVAQAYEDVCLSRVKQTQTDSTATKDCCHAIWIVALGTLIGFAFQYLSLFVVKEIGFIGTIIGAIIMLIVWLGLIKHFFDTGWGMSFVIAIIAIIIYIIIAFILALIFGLALIGAGIL